jgi:hypothetical protein
MRLPLACPLASALRHISYLCESVGGSMADRLIVVRAAYDPEAKVCPSLPFWTEHKSIRSGRNTNR